jgi:hypothetical protein
MKLKLKDFVVGLVLLIPFFWAASMVIDLKSQFKFNSVISIIILGMIAYYPLFFSKNIVSKVLFYILFTYIIFYNLNSYLVDIYDFLVQNHGAYSSLEHLQLVLLFVKLITLFIFAPVLIWVYSKLKISRWIDFALLSVFTLSFIIELIIL